MPGGEIGEARGPNREGRAGEILRKSRAGQEDWRREAGARRRLGPAARLPPLPPDGGPGKGGSGRGEGGGRRGKGSKSG